MKPSRIAVSIVSVLACALTLVQCSRSGSRMATVPHVLRFADVSDPDRLNPYMSTMDLVYDLSSMIYSYLILADDKGNLTGDLATEVPTLANRGISSDGKTYIYHLRRGVVWHDGAPLTAQDVRFSWQAVVNPNNNTLHREGYDEVASIDTPDRDTVVVHLKRRYPPFVTRFFTPLQEGGKGILPAHLLAHYASINTVPFNAAPIGSGPFQFVRWERAHEIVLARNPRYFKGTPRLQKIEFFVIPNDQTMLNELRLHHIDLITSPTTTLRNDYRNSPGVMAELTPWNAQSLFIINNSRPGLSDVRVRRALTMAIDYDAIIAKVTHGVGERAYDIVPPTAIGYTKNPPYQYDPRGAQAALEAAGYRRGPDGVRARGKVRLDYTLAIISGSTSQQLAAVQLQQYLRAIGIGLALKPYEYNAIFVPTGPIYGNRYDFAIYSVTLPWDPDNLFYLGCAFFYPKGENVYRYCDRTVDDLEKRGLQTDDPAKRAAIYHQAERRIWQTVPYIPLYQLRRDNVYSAGLQNFKASPGSTPWYNIWQWDI
ncbi:MAG TPA: peptide ABC transporter substrate-binding protein [Candidatus Rubrimentiphilum sp.]|nr:peptide ABC transporter substrate-binding protein [Candidatus Rubrimentiphilum sp.]